MKIKPFGFDIGASETKIVWLAEDKNVFSIRAASSVPTPPKGMLSDSPLDQEAMAHVIRTLLSDTKITVPHVNIALPDNQVYTRVVEMPPLSEKELAGAMLWEAEQYIPLKLSEITLDWSILRKPEKGASGDTMDVLLVGAPTVLLDRYQKVLALAGLSINSVETEILASLRPFIRDEKMPSTLLVHIGALSTSFAIVKRGRVVFTYVIATGGIALNRAIATDFGLSVSQAQTYKTTYGVLRHELEGKIGEAATPVLMAIITEIKKSLSLYNDKYKNDIEDVPVRQILLSGADAIIPGLDLFFADHCGIETVMTNPFKSLGIENVPKTLMDEASGYAVVVGLAMRDYE